MSRTTLGTITITVALALVALGASIAQGGFVRTELSGPFLGTYTAKLSAREAIAQGDVRMTGRFRLVLRGNGTYSVTNPLDPTASGRFVALPNKRLRFFKDSGCVYGGFERPKGGVYGWSVNGRKLTLRLVSEGACTGRTQSLTYVVWTRR